MTTERFESFTESFTNPSRKTARREGFGAKQGESFTLCVKDCEGFGKDFNRRKSIYNNTLSLLLIKSFLLHARKRAGAPARTRGRCEGFAEGFVGDPPYGMVPSPQPHQKTAREHGARLGRVGCRGDATKGGDQI